MFAENNICELLRKVSSTEVKYVWKEKNALVALYKICVNAKKGAVLYYHNPPVHVVSTKILCAIETVLKSVQSNIDEFEFLVFWSASDPVHAGGDLKETLENLKVTIKEKMLIAGGTEATEQKKNKLYDWADQRIYKAFDLYLLTRSLSVKLRTIAMYGGGIHYGGSAEIPLWADIIIADSRSSICFSEALIGLIPGWAGIGRIISKAGYLNARILTETARQISARDLKKIGVCNAVVNIDSPFPEFNRYKTQSEEYETALWKHHEKTSVNLLRAALKYAISDRAWGKKKVFSMLTVNQLKSEIETRSNPKNYRHLYGMTLESVRKSYKDFLRPLSSRSLFALNMLFNTYDQNAFDEKLFVKKEAELDSELYRNDTELIIGIESALERIVPAFG